MRTVPAMNGSVPYVEGTYMVACRDSSATDSVYIVGPDEGLRIVIDKPGSLVERIRAAKKVAEMLNKSAISSGEGR